VQDAFVNKALSVCTDRSCRDVADGDCTAQLRGHAGAVLRAACRQATMDTLTFSAHLGGASGVHRYTGGIPALRLHYVLALLSAMAIPSALDRPGGGSRTGRRPA